MVSASDRNDASLWPLDASSSSASTTALEPPTLAPTLFKALPALTDQQEIVLSLLFVISGTLSILGSSTIVYKVVRNRRQSTPYDRIMLGLSLTDIVASSSYVLSPFFMPAVTSSRIWAIGTTATCSFLGFLTQLSFAAVMYNAILSYYYLLTVRFGIKRHDFARRYEPCMHGSTFVFFATTASIGAGLGAYNELELGLGCWLNDYPAGCEETETCISHLLGWGFAAAPSAFAFLSIVINNIVIYRHVRRTLGTNQQEAKEQPPPQKDKMSSTPQSTKTDNTTTAPSSGRSLGTKSESFMTIQEQERQFRQQVHVREVAQQGFLYVATFMICYLPALLVRALEAVGYRAEHEPDLYWILVLHNALLPLQGLWNMLVYTRPSYVRVRAAYPDSSTFWALRKACLDSDIPRLSDVSRAAWSSRIHSAGSNRRIPAEYNHNNKSRSGISGFSSNLNSIPEDENEDCSTDYFLPNPDAPVAAPPITTTTTGIIEPDQQVDTQNDHRVGGSKDETVNPDNTIHGTSDHSIDILTNDLSDSSSTTSSFDDLEESLNVFREAASSLKRLGMDGAIYNE